MCICFCASIGIYSQSFTKFKDILSQDIAIDSTQKLVNSFLEKNIESLSKEELAECYHAYGTWFYRKQRNKEGIKSAIIYTNKAANLKRKIENLNPKSLKKTLYNLGFFHGKDDDFAFAIKYYQEIIEISSINKKTIEAHRALGNIYIQFGDFHKALDHIDHMIELLRDDYGTKEILIQGYLTRADINSKIGYNTKSKEIIRDIQEIDQLLQNIELPKNKLNSYKVRKNLLQGNLFLKINEFDKAIINFNKTLDNLSLSDSINRAITHNSLGLLFLKTKKNDQSEINLTKAINYNKLYSLSYENLGDLYIAKKEFTKALESYQKAIQYNIDPNKPHDYKDSIEIEDLVLLSNKYYTLSHLIQKANAWIQYYHHDQNKDNLYQAIKTFKIADQLVDIIRFESSEYRSKLYWRERASALYLNAVAASFLLNNHKDAYYFMEKNKAILLLEDITNEQAKENTKLPEDLANREFLLKQNIYLSENRLNTLTDTSEDAPQKTKKEIYNHKKNYEVFVDSLHLLYPDYAINKQKIKVLPYDSFTSQFISDQEVVLQYILSEDEGYGIFHSRDQQLFFKIPRVNELSQDITLLNKQVTNWFRNEEELKAYHKTAYQIFQKLIPSSVFSILKGKNITIIPDYALQQLSFETLITSDKEHSYLIKDVEIRYAYSMSYLDQNDQKERNAPLDFLGVAPVDFKIENLGSLVHSKKEITTITDILSGDVLLEEQGTKTNVLDSIDQYRIIHLSTHADIEHHTSPWIAFRNQKITLQEIYATKNQSEMVVLSACKTSLGELNKGEGIMSLARGFFHSGTNSVVSSLWSVNDKANQELMINFYKNIDQGLSKSSALRNAKLQYINSHDGSELSPFYWGSLILIGNNDPIPFSNHLSSFLWIAILLVIIGIIILIYFRKTRKS
ncbi:CHAT domain-containing protein [uncultured Aquimarina sp.]|uniref:CHAT domain-containing protein n=1 Tax=uncultured Aquimarina sp. TaxID=575652 RepID=UPI00262EF4E5|nr:CHAT domain-containing protein [uncultured Aquimarina sp.]